MITFKQFLLLEAREDTIVKNQGHQILTAIYNKDKNFLQITKPFDQLTQNDALNIVKDMVEILSDHGLLPYLQWVVNQYIKDPHFKFEDFPSITDLLTLYNQLKRRQGETVNKNILSYQTIEQLQDDVQKYSQQPGQENTLTTTIYNTMTDQVNRGNAKWFYKSNNIMVYQPLKYEAAKSIREAVGENNISLCVTYTHTDKYYYEYTNGGDLFFILTPKMMYSFYFGQKDKEPEKQDINVEIADILNNHKRGEEFARQNATLFKKIFKHQLDNISKVGFAPLGGQFIFDKLDSIDPHYFEDQGCIPCLVWFLVEYFPERWKKAEPIIIKDPIAVVYYASDILKQRWQAAEPFILENAELAEIVQYAQGAIKGRWPEAEAKIITSPNYACHYAIDVIKGRWKEAEPIIMTHPHFATTYAIDVLKKRWHKAEPIIKQNSYEWKRYTQELIGE